MFLGFLFGFTAVSVALILLLSQQFPKKARRSIDEMVTFIPRQVKSEHVMLFAASDGAEKSEKATPKREQDSRKKGQVAKSTEIPSFLTLVMSVVMSLLFGQTICFNFMEAIQFYIQASPNVIGHLEGNGMALFHQGLLFFLPALLFFILPIMATGVFGHLIQTGFILTGEPLKFKLEKINPIKGMKNMFSKRRLMDLIKNLAKLGVVAILSWQYLKGEQEVLKLLPSYPFMKAITIFGELVMGLVSRLLIFAGVLAAADYTFQRYQHGEDLKMTKQEVKEEHKQMEGDPYIKGLRRQKQRELALQRKMLKQVPDATVILVNPTHYAIALRYKEGLDGVPLVLAKGTDRFALKIKDIAMKEKIPVIEDISLTRALYPTVEPGQPIPEVFYAAISKILASVMALEQKRQYR